MYIIAKTRKNKEFIYNNRTSIMGIFKLNEGEIWHFYEIGNWEVPRYKLASVKGKISIRENI